MVSVFERIAPEQTGNQAGEPALPVGQHVMLRTTPGTAPDNIATIALFRFFARPWLIAISRISAGPVTICLNSQVHTLDGQMCLKVGLSWPGTYCTTTSEKRGGALGCQSIRPRAVGG